MTRINSGVHPTRLIDTHLFAEWRELPRILTAVYEGKAKGTPPSTFRLKTGHVCFFYDKLEYLCYRYVSLCDELLTRKIDIPRDTCDSVIHAFLKAKELFPERWNNYDDSNDFPILEERLIEKFNSMTIGKFRWYKQPISREFAYELLMGKHESKI